MLDFILKTVLDFLPHPYLLLFRILVLCGMGLPMPEDIVIITGGYLAYLGKTNLVWTMIVLWTGAIFGDCMLYWVGRRYGTWLLEHRIFVKNFSPRTPTKDPRLFSALWECDPVFRQVFGRIARTALPDFGSFRVSFTKMLLLDGLAGLLSIPLITYIAFRFGEAIDSVKESVRNAEYGLMIVIAVVVAALILKNQIQKRLNKKGQENSAPS